MTRIQRFIIKDCVPFWLIWSAFIVLWLIYNSKAIIPDHIKFHISHFYTISGFKNKYSRRSMAAGCDFCYFIVVSTSKPDRPILPLTDTGLYQIELTCTYRPYAHKKCPHMLQHVKEGFVSRAMQLGDTPTQYVNTPSCDLRRDFQTRWDYLLRLNDYMTQDKYGLKAHELNNLFHIWFYYSKTRDRSDWFEN